MKRRTWLRTVGLGAAGVALTGIRLDPAASDSTLGTALRHDRDGWIFVHIAGPPRARGFQYGFLLAPEIDDFISTLKVYLLQNTTKDWQFYRQAAAEIFLPKL